MTGEQESHWETLFRVAMVDRENIERAYLAERREQPVSATPHVFIAMPSARSPGLAVRKSIERVVVDLMAHEVAVTVFETPGDSLVTRGRHALMHEFLCSPATHMLQWDDDVECLDASAVRNMLASGRHVVGGAYPFRDGSGRVCANPPHDAVNGEGVGKVDVDPQAKCIRVSEVGTGFLLTSRRCIVDLMARHPELMYMADIDPYAGVPMWALFDTHLEMMPHGRRRYASEDWRFCQLARGAGYDVSVYYPPVFRHWGMTAHEGHIVKAWQMNGATT